MKIYGRLLSDRETRELLLREVVSALVPKDELESKQTVTIVIRLVFHNFFSCTFQRNKQLLVNILAPINAGNCYITMQLDASAFALSAATRSCSLCNFQRRSCAAN
jgi:hypothetical protein